MTLPEIKLRPKSNVIIQISTTDKENSFRLKGAKKTTYRSIIHRRLWQVHMEKKMEKREF